MVTRVTIGPLPIALDLMENHTVMKRIFTFFPRNSRFGALLFLTCMVHQVGGQSSHTVDVTNNVFTPAQITITTGDTVIWTNSEGFHNVNGTQTTYPSNPESFGNGTGAGWTYSHVFTIPGTYDYQCDPHVGLGMVGQVIVEDPVSEEPSLTINFTGMTPHVGQTLWLLVEDRDEGTELLRMTRVIEESFSIEVPGIIAGNDYRVEFFADHNGNGGYDDPPTDHAWRYDLDAVSENEVLDFAHNTDFQDIDWDHRVIVNLSGMTPHVGQESYFALIDVASGNVHDRESEIVSDSFRVELSKSMSGSTYRVDFFSDHNGNGYYDAPPADHAWRLEFESSAGDDTLNFVHNTNFTDVMWKHRLRVRFSGMTPHVGQMLTLYVRDLASGTYLDTVVIASIEAAEFDVESHVVEAGNSYMVDFFADHNGSGTYDAPPTDHAWRLETGVAMGDVDLDFVHNTNFTDIFSTTSVSNQAVDFGLTLYPVPARGHVFVESELAISLLTLYDVTGARIKTVDGLSLHLVNLSLEGIQPGLYFMEVRSVDHQRTIARFVKQ